ncbi:uncharacterized protein LOC112874050 isoform X1 [Panicum hallii]|uniref:uncharacterized protein LOC112874050 isoform X1 n=1 Tax=Panicum hallii TaxID=206008 RepID=UPI000DF4CC09|nr:uncharacterized protein LOC112874050 isoform X1 [Panicum hallii]
MSTSTPTAEMTTKLVRFSSILATFDNEDPNEALKRTHQVVVIPVSGEQQYIVKNDPVGGAALWIGVCPAPEGNSVKEIIPTAAKTISDAATEVKRAAENIKTEFESFIKTVTKSAKVTDEDSFKNARKAVKKTIKNAQDAASKAVAAASDLETATSMALDTPANANNTTVQKFDGASHPQRPPSRDNLTAGAEKIQITPPCQMLMEQNLPAHQPI